jgi:hypothetical protein
MARAAHRCPAETARPLPVVPVGEADLAPLELTLPLTRLLGS